MEEYLAKGKTVDEAISLGLKEMDLSLDEVEIDIIEDGSGMFGFSKAKVLLTKKSGLGKRAEDFLSTVFSKMNIATNLDIEEKEDSISIDIVGSNLGVLIGHRGETLDALQYLTSLVVNKGSDTEYKRIFLDTENYRQKREIALKKLANKLARKVVDTNRRVRLEPMNPYERRVIHATLQDYPKIRTYSKGDEPNRNVVIEKVR